MRIRSITLAATGALLALTGCTAQATDDPPAVDTPIVEAPDVTDEDTLEPTEPTEPYELTDADLDAVFLDTMHDEDPEWATVPDKQLTGIARTVCEQIDAGITTPMDQMLIAQDSGFAPYDAGFLVGASIGVYCPEFTDQIAGSAL